MLAARQLPDTLSDRCARQLNTYFHYQRVYLHTHCLWTLQKSPLGHCDWRYVYSVQYSAPHLRSCCTDIGIDLINPRLSWLKSTEIVSVMRMYPLGCIFMLASNVRMVHSVDWACVVGAATKRSNSIAAISKCRSLRKFWAIMWLF